jgi:hypothetical protein
MKPTIRAENNATRFLFTDHGTELQSRAGAWFSERMAELREPLRTLVAQRLFLFEEGSAELRRLISVEFSLTFQRTLRVPDDGRAYPLPAGLGRLPVRSARALKSTAIPQAWRDSPTGIIPLHPAEAAWISFSGSHPFAVQIAAGGICAASGLPHVAALCREPQNYLSTPTQPWLDGFRVDAHTVRQFVAMPLGHGYTVEGQLTGQETRGAVQIRVVPLTVDALWTQHILPRCSERWKTLTRPVCAEDDILLSRGGFCSIEASCSVCEEAGFGAGGRIRQEIYADPLPREAWDEPGALACEHHLILADRWMEFTGEPMPTPPPTPRDYAEAGLPWFDYTSPAQPITTPAPLAGVSSVATLFKAKSGLDLPENQSFPAPPTQTLHATEIGTAHGTP